MGDTISQVKISILKHNIPFTSGYVPNSHGAPWQQGKQMRYRSLRSTEKTHHNALASDVRSIVQSLKISSDTWGISLNPPTPCLYYIHPLQA